MSDQLILSYHQGGLLPRSCSFNSRHSHPTRQVLQWLGISLWPPQSLLPRKGDLELLSDHSIREIPEVLMLNPIKSLFLTYRHTTSINAQRARNQPHSSFGGHGPLPPLPPGVRVPALLKRSYPHRGETAPASSFSGPRGPPSLGAGWWLQLCSNQPASL